MLALNRYELQVIGVPLVVGVAVAWGALHLFAIADRETSPRIYAIVRIVLILISLAAVAGGASWVNAQVG